MTVGFLILDGRDDRYLLNAGEKHGVQDLKLVSFS